MAVRVQRYRPGDSVVSPLYLDSNFIVATLNNRDSLYRRALPVLRELLRQRIEVFISTLAVDEVWWRLLEGLTMGARANVPPGTGRQPLGPWLKQNSHELTNLGQSLQQIWSGLRNWPRVRYLPTQRQQSQTVILDALTWLQTERLGPRDSFHLSLALSSGAKGYLTADNDFDHLLGKNYTLTVYKF